MHLCSRSPTICPGHGPPPGQWASEGCVDEKTLPGPHQRGHSSGLAGGLWCSQDSALREGTSEPMSLGGWTRVRTWLGLVADQVQRGQMLRPPPTCILLS